MTKRQLSTYEREMQNPEFKKAYQEMYKELLFSELLIDLIEDKSALILLHQVINLLKEFE